MSEVQWSPQSGIPRTVPVCAADARRLAGAEAPKNRMIRVGDLHVPEHEAGGFEAVLDRSRSLAHEHPTSHNKNNITEAHLNQTLNGVNEIGGGRR